MRLFTLDEATALLPELRRLFARIRSERNTIRRLEPEAKLAQEQAEQGGGGSPHGAQYINALFSLMNAAGDINELGVEIKDLERGLCDFPSLRDGRIVYLCWLLGEDAIEWWHDTDTGFSGRQPL